MICLKTALEAFDAIVSRARARRMSATDSHYQRFIAIREELQSAEGGEPGVPAGVSGGGESGAAPAGARRRACGSRTKQAAAVVDVANSAYMLMLRLISHSYLLPRPHPAKALSIDLALGLMRAVTPLAEAAARLPAGPSNPGCNAGMSFTALRDAAPLPPGASAGRFFLERLQELCAGAGALISNARTAQALRVLKELTTRATRDFAQIAREAPVVLSAGGPAPRWQR